MTEHGRRMQELLGWLSSGNLYTATQLAAIMGVTKVSVYDWLTDLEAQGFELQIEPLRTNRLGPLALHYAVVGDGSETARRREFHKTHFYGLGAGLRL